MIVLTMCLLTIVLILLWISHRKRNRGIIELSRKMPGPTALPIIGNLLDLGSSYSGIITNILRLKNKYRKTFRIWCGPKLIVVIADLSHIEIILRHPRLLEKPWAYKYARPWVGTGLVHSVGEKWKQHRKLYNAALHFKYLEGYVNVFNKHVEVLVKKLASCVDGSEFDTYGYICLFTLDSIIETSIGKKLNNQGNKDSEYARAVEKIFSTIIYRLTRPWLHFDFTFNMTTAGKHQRESIKVVHSLAYKAIAEKREHLKNSKNVDNSTSEVFNDTGRRPVVPILETMLKASEDDIYLPDEHIREEIDTILSAGYETTAIALSFGCWALAQNQHVQDKVVLEIADIIGDSDRLPTYNDLNEMKYLEMVIKEILRLYPSIPIFGRELQEDIDIGDYVLPAGTNVVISPLLTHRDPELFPQPEKFDPERFLPENISQRHPYSYVPFSAGPKNCVGWKYGLLIMKATYVGLLRKYKLLPGKKPLTLEWRVSLATKEGMNIKLELRKK